jgi:hypothetical protein
MQQERTLLRAQIRFPNRIWAFYSKKLRQKRDGTTLPILCHVRSLGDAPSADPSSRDRPRWKTPLDKYLTHPVMTVPEVALGVLVLTNYASIATEILVFSLIPAVFLGAVVWARNLKRRLPSSRWTQMSLMGIVFALVSAWVTSELFGQYGLTVFIVLTATLTLTGFIFSLYLTFQKAYTGAILSAVFQPSVGIVKGDIIGIGIAAALWLLGEWLFSKRPKSWRDLSGIS